MNTIIGPRSVPLARPASLVTLAPTPTEVDDFVKDLSWSAVGTFPVMGAALNGIGAGCAAEGCSNPSARAVVRSAALVGTLANIGGCLTMSGHPLLGIAGLAVSGTCLGLASHVLRKFAD
jgi:hypothetical protein